jgi:Spy/CpxP family protein refolding chaperone
MKKILVVLLAAAISWCTISVSFAETAEQAAKVKNVTEKVHQVSSKEKMMPAPEVQLNRLTKGLQLTPEQKELVRPILNDEHIIMKEIRSDENLSPKQIHVKVGALRKETASKIQTILTPEQIEKYNIVSAEISSTKHKRMKDNRNKRLGTNADPPDEQPK